MEIINSNKSRIDVVKTVTKVSAPNEHFQSSREKRGNLYDLVMMSFTQKTTKWKDA